MLNVSLPVADAIFTVANIILVIGAILAFVGTAAVFWSTGIRERYADERTATNEAQTAKANAEAAQARLEQERLKSQMAWRRVSAAHAQKMVQVLRGTKLETWDTFVGSDPEATLYREDVNAVLEAAGVKTKFYSGYARAIGLGVRGGTAEQRAALVQAFEAAGLQVINSTDPGFGKNELEVLVGSKPPPVFQ